MVLVSDTIYENNKFFNNMLNACLRSLCETNSECKQTNDLISKPVKTSKVLKAMPKGIKPLGNSNKVSLPMQLKKINKKIF